MESLKTVTLVADEVVISFDVISLYTNVPVKEAIQEAAERLYCSNVKAPPVDKETFIILATLFCNNVLMQTHDGTYKQNDGLAMGSPPAPLLSSSIRDDAELFDCYTDDIVRTIKVDLI